jgi:hypothetical protein
MGACLGIQRSINIIFIAKEFDTLPTDRTRTCVLRVFPCSCGERGGAVTYNICKPLWMDIIFCIQ